MTRRDLLRNPSLLALLARDVVSTTGSQMTYVALPWFVLTTTGSPTRMTIVFAVEAASTAAFGFLLGNVVTRLGPRRTMLIADAVRAPLIALVPLLHWADALSFGAIIAIAAAVSAFTTPSFASKAALIPDLVGEDEARLSEANALVQAVGRLTLLAGPPLGGVLIAFIGATNVLLIDAVTFVVGFALVAVFIKAQGHAPEPEDRGLSAGARHIWRDRLLRPWGISVIVSDACWLALFAALPVLVLERYGAEPEIVGWAWGAWGGGALLGSVLAFRYVASVDRLLLSSIGEIVMIAPLWLLLIDAPPLAVVGTMLVSGFANGVINAPVHTIVMLRTPRALRQKVWGFFIVGMSVLGPVALIAAGPSLEHIGLNPTLIALFAVQTLCAIAFAVAGLRERGRSAVASEPVAD